MGEINYDKLRAALDNLRGQYRYFKEVRSDPDSHEAAIQRAVNYSIAHSFAICFESLWRHIRRYLERNAAVTTAKNPKAVFRGTYESGTIDEWMLERLLKYHKLRNSINSDYDQKRERAVLGAVDDFIEDAENLYAIIAIK